MQDKGIVKGIFRGNNDDICLFLRAMSQVPCLHEHLANAARVAKRQWRLFSNDRSGAETKYPAAYGGGFGCVPSMALNFPMVLRGIPLRIGRPGCGIRCGCQKRYQYACRGRRLPYPRQCR